MCVVRSAREASHPHFPIKSANFYLWRFASSFSLTGEAAALKKQSSRMPHRDFWVSAEIMFWDENLLPIQSTTS